MALYNRLLGTHGLVVRPDSDEHLGHGDRHTPLAEIRTFSSALCQTQGLSTLSTCHVTKQCSHLGGQDGEGLGLAWGLVPNFDGGGTLLRVGLELNTHV